MGTVALIGIVNDRHPKRVKFTTLMTDGYVSEAGLKLIMHYNSTKKAHTLIEQGTIVILGNNKDNPTKHSHRDFDYDWNEHKPQESSEGEFFLSKEAAVKYLYDDGEWYIYLNHKGGEPLNLLNYIKSCFEKTNIKIDDEQEKLRQKCKAIAEAEQ